MSKLIDETGNKYDRWYVNSFAYIKDHKAYWNCTCDCGTIRPVTAGDLRNGKSTNCGCVRNEKNAKRSKLGLSDETRKKLSETRIELGLAKGKNNPNYKHGMCGTKEYGRESGKQWREKNPDKVKVSRSKRRALLKGAEGTHTPGDLKYIYDHQQGKCPCCKKYIPFDKITVDHIIPLTWGGSNYPSNIQLLCKSCNSSKGNHHNTDYRDYIPLFLENIKNV